jgi:hypothetical protein
VRQLDHESSLHQHREDLAADLEAGRPTPRPFPVDGSCSTAWTTASKSFAAS